MNWIDLTLSREACEKQGLSEDALVAWCRNNAKTWCIGRETGDTGYEHYQCRMQTLKSLEEMKAIFGKCGRASATHAKNYDYVTKDGNYICSWLMALKKWAVASLKPWQEALKGALMLQDDRTITVLVDAEGGSGKSFLAKHLEGLGVAKRIPVLGTATDILSACMVSPSDAYVFDIPRSEDATKRHLWSAIEQVKDGYLYDWRYQYREEQRDSPRILVMTNKCPDLSALSADRWDIIHMSDIEQTGELPL